MSKDKITHKEHRQLLSGLYKKQGGKWIYQADTYIKQQEKQEKLLELYKELITLLMHTTWSWKSYIEIKEIQEKIKELEK